MKRLIQLLLWLVPVVLVLFFAIDSISMAQQQQGQQTPTKEPLWETIIDKLPKVIDIFKKDTVSQPNTVGPQSNVAGPQTNVVGSQPKITAMTPTYADGYTYLTMGKTFTIHGNNFSPYATENSIIIGPYVESTAQLTKPDSSVATFQPQKSTSDRLEAVMPFSISGAPNWYYLWVNTVSGGWSNPMLVGIVSESPQK